MSLLQDFMKPEGEFHGKHNILSDVLNSASQDHGSHGHSDPHSGGSGGGGFLGKMGGFGGLMSKVSAALKQDEPPPPSVRLLS